MNPLAMAAATIFAFLFVFKNATMEGPAPLIVTHAAPIDVADQQDRRLGMAGDPHVGQVGVA